MRDFSITEPSPLHLSEPPLPNSDANVSLDFDCLHVPPLYPFLDDQDLDLTENFDIEPCFDDIGDLYFPSEEDSFLIFNQLDSTIDPLHCVDSNAAQQELSQISVYQSVASDPNACFTNRGPDVPTSMEPGNSEVPGDHGGVSVSQYLNCTSVEWGDCGLSDGAPARGFKVAFPVSSQDFRNCGSRVSEAMNSTSSPDSGNFLVGQRVEKEGLGHKDCSTKGKKETSDDPKGDSRTGKCQRSEIGNDTSTQQQLSEEEEEKRRARLMRKRESDQLSRQRKKQYVEELEGKVRSMHSTIEELNGKISDFVAENERLKKRNRESALLSRQRNKQDVEKLEDKVRSMRSTIADLNGKISYLMAENSSLRQQLSSSVMCPPPPGMYPPMGLPMAYPWVPYPPYVVKPQGPRVPLVPIPSLEPEQLLSAAKVRLTQLKKREAKTKKVASVSFLGLLFFIFVFGGLVPFVKVKFGGIWDNGPGGSGVASPSIYDQHRGRVLEVNGHLNSSLKNINEKLRVGSKAPCERGHKGESEMWIGSVTGPSPKWQVRQRRRKSSTIGREQVWQGDKEVGETCTLQQNEKKERETCKGENETATTTLDGQDFPTGEIEQQEAEDREDTCRILEN